MDKSLLGKWTETEDQSYPGLFFLFSRMALLNPTMMP